MPPRRAAASNIDLLLADAVGAAHGGGDRLAERGLVDEVVLDHGRGDLGLVHPIRSQERRGLSGARLARCGRSGAVDERGRRGKPCAQDGRQGDRVLGLEVNRLVERAALGAGQEVLHAAAARGPAWEPVKTFSMPPRLASWPVVGTLLAGTPFCFRTVTTAFASPSFAS